MSFSDYVSILLETSLVRKLLSHVCRCPIEFVLDGNILLYNGVLSLRLHEYLGLEWWSNITNGRS